VISVSATYDRVKRYARERLDLHQREKPNNVLVATAAIQGVLMLGMLVVLPLDTRLVSGVNPWFKPIRFTQSIAALALTVAWLLDYLQISRRGKQVISWGISGCVMAQIGCIILQAARGTTSHFNRSTPFDTAVSLFMDVLDPVNSLFVIALLVYAYQGKFAVSRPAQWGIATGLMIFLGSSAIGGVMIANGAHSVGGVGGDGGPGLPLLHWSTTGGDLRPAHFLGLHALQILPIAGWLINLWPGGSMRAKLTGVVAVAVTVVALVTFLFLQALSGTPVVRL